MWTSNDFFVKKFPEDFSSHLIKVWLSDIQLLNMSEMESSSLFNNQENRRTNMREDMNNVDHANKKWCSLMMASYSYQNYPLRYESMNWIWKVYAKCIGRDYLQPSQLNKSEKKWLIKFVLIFTRFRWMQFLLKWFLLKSGYTARSDFFVIFLFYERTKII